MRRVEEGYQGSRHCVSVGILLCADWMMVPSYGVVAIG